MKINTENYFNQEDYLIIFENAWKLIKSNLVNNNNNKEFIKFIEDKQQESNGIDFYYLEDDDVMYMWLKYKTYLLLYLDMLRIAENYEEISHIKKILSRYEICRF